MKLTTQFRESEYRKQQVISPVSEPRKQLLLDPGFDLKSGFQRRRLLSPLHVHSGSHTLALDKHSYKSYLCQRHPRLPLSQYRPWLKAQGHKVLEEGFSKMTNTTLSTKPTPALGENS